MNKKVLIITIVLVICTVICTACTDSTPDFTDYGYSVSGKITLHDLPDGISTEVSILVNGIERCKTDENGTFSVNKLVRRDEITFSKDNVEFYPDKHIVIGDLHDLRVDGYYEEKDTPDNGSNDNTDDGDGTVDDGDDVTPPNDNQDNGDNNNSSGDDDNINVYNCINAGLLFENNRVNFVFCVNKDFLSLSVSALIQDTNHPIDIDDTMTVCELTIGSEMYIQYSVDVTDLAIQDCIFTAVAYNEENQPGTIATVSFVPIGVCQQSIISLDGSTLTIDNLDPDAVNYLIINGVSVCEITSTSLDISSILAHNSSQVSIRVLTYKAGYIPTLSNEIITTLNIYDI